MSESAREVAFPPAPGVWDQHHRQTTLGILLQVTGIASTMLAIGTVMPKVAQELDGLALYGWTFSAALLTNVIGLIYAGTEADRRGPFRPFTIGAGCYATGLLIAGLAPLIQVLILGRMIQGFGAGALANVAYVAIGRRYPEELRPRMLAMLSTAWVVPGLVGPAIAGAVADTFGWRWIFLILVLPVPLAALLLGPALRQMDIQTRRPIDWHKIRQAIVLAVGFGCVFEGLGAKLVPIAILLLGIGAALALPAFRAIMPAGFLRVRRGLPAALMTMALLNLVYFGVESFLPLALVEVRDIRVAVAGLVLTVATITWTLGAWLQVRLARRVPRHITAMLGLSIIGLGIALVITLLFVPMPLLMALLGWATAGLGIGLTYSTLSLVVLETAPSGQEGQAVAAMSLADVLGNALGAGLGGSLVAHALAVGDPLSLGVGAQFICMFLLISAAIVTAARMRPA